MDVVLPDEALPSLNELERDFEAITISHGMKHSLNWIILCYFSHKTELMDDDLRAALFDDADENGEFEELDDNFIEQVISKINVIIVS